MKDLILCADDFAQSPGISDGILALIATGRLSATSVFSQSPWWPNLAPALKGLEIDVGLHLNLTEPYANGHRPLSWWLLHSQLRHLPRQQLRQQFIQQIDAFSEATGQLPAYLDGHQHVHALPVVRNALTDAIQACWPTGNRPYVRQPDRLADAGDSRVKAGILRACTAGFSQHLQQHDLQGPGWFAGLYCLQAQADFPGLIRRWLDRAPAGGLIMCHPGQADALPDSIAAARQQEYAWLASAGFAEDCERFGVRLTGYRQTGQ